jgi:outer membrane protein assembly factor BamB
MEEGRSGRSETMNDSGDPGTCEPLARARYQAALASAVVAGLFSLIIIVALGVAHIRTRTDDFHKSEELAGLRAALLKAPDAAAASQIKEELRDRDLRMREDYFARAESSRSGGYMLIGGVIVFVIAAMQAAASRKRLPMPRPDPDAPRKAAGAQRLARATVVGLGIAIGAAGIVLGVVSGGSLLVQPPPAENGGVVAPPAAQDFPTAEEIAKEWPRFRGPGGAGVAAYKNIPSAWDGKTGDGILWKAALPLPGQNSPVVWGDRIFLSGATEKKREVYCIDAATGKLLWQKPVDTPEGAAAEPPELLEDTGYAAPTVATDGRRVAAIFANSDIACFDMSGKKLWARNFGVLKNSYGHATSLDMYHGRVMVLLDQGTPAKPASRLIAIDAATGKTAWETKRPVPASWATPILINTGKREEFITIGKPWAIAYDPASGTELWRAKVLDGDVAPSPVFAAGLVFTVNTGAKLSAIRPDGQGDVTASAVAWAAEDGLPDIVSPLTDGKLIWLFTTDGTLTCYRVKDGSKVYEKEIGEAVNSSPTLVGDKMYVFDEKGVTHFLATGEEFKELGKAALGEPVRASPAYLDGRIYVRTMTKEGVSNLFAIGKK